MMFFKRLFGRKEKAASEPVHGLPSLQTQAEQDATRERMEAEMDADRERRNARDASNDAEQPPPDESESA
jgi:hypothetical protein